MRVPWLLLASWRLSGSTAAECGAPDLLSLVLHGMRAASLAPTPAFNLHDHFQLAGAVATAACSVSDMAATSVEVGSFAGHTLLFSAAVLRYLGTQEGPPGRVVGVEPKLRGNALNRSAAQLQRRITHFPAKAEEMRVWASRQRLRLFFEDGRHTYTSTAASFNVFEPSLVMGGVLVMHDVGCCGSEYPGLLRFLREHVLRNGSGYRELHFPVPTWESLQPSMEQELVDMLEASADRRSFSRRHVFRRMPVEHRYLPPCAELCASSSNENYNRLAESALARGYQWSLCPNVRVFQRVGADRSP